MRLRRGQDRRRLLLLNQGAENQLLELPSFTSPVFAYSAHEDDTGLLYEDAAKAVPATDDNDPVYTIVQVSGFGAVDGVQATTANRALLRTGANGINGHNCLQFDGINDFYTLTGITASSGAKTFYIVTKPDSATGSDDYYFDTQTGRIALAHFLAANTTGYFDGTGHNIAASTATAQILCFALGSGTGTIYRNGSSLGSDTYTNRAIGSTTILGARFDTAAAFFTGRIGAIYCDNALHDVTKRGEVHAYLSQQWGITVS